MKILIAGLGSAGQRHVRNLRAEFGGGVELLAYRVRGLPHVITEQMTLLPGPDVEARYGIRAFDRLEDALAEQPAATLVCNPSSAHLATAMVAVRAGSHVFIEKPLSHTMDGVEALAELIDERQLIATVGYQLRFHPALLRVRDLLVRGAVGPVVAVRAEWHEYLPDAHPYEDYRQSYAARAELGGGVLLNYIHEFDYLQWLFGLPARVSAIGGRVGELEIDVEDTASTTMECQVGGRAVTISLQLCFGQRVWSRTCEITGEAGAIHLDLRAPSVRVTDRDGHATANYDFAGFSRNQLFVDELKHFLSAMAGNHPPAVPVREAARSLRVALAARASLATGRVVEVS